MALLEERRTDIRVMASNALL